MNGSSRRIYLLGEPRVSASDSALGMRERVIALLGYLVLHRGQTLHRDAVAFALWPDDEEVKARGNLRRHIHLINKELTPEGGEAPLTSVRRTIGWNPKSEVWVDVIAFEDLAARADTAPAAIDLYAGDFLPRQDYEWASGARERLRGRAMNLLDELSDRASEAGDLAAAIDYGRRLLALDPWREDTVRKLIALRRRSGDRAGALQEYNAFAKALQEEMGAEPMPETQALLEEEPAEAPRPTPRDNVPTPLTKFLGRDREYEALEARAGAHRLVTLVGFGGIGKTRLAIEFAARAAEDGTRGVWFVPLSAVADSTLVASAIMQALSLREEPGKSQVETLVTYLQPRDDLIVLDACENLRTPVAVLCQELLSACARLRILATSRVVLGCPGESPFRLRPFGESDGVSLFCERAAAVLPSFALTPVNEPLIAHIVRRLEGIPLALELAAARTKVMSLQSLSRRLDDRFEILSRERPSSIPGHQTLQAAIDWSYGLLTEEERRLFARLSIFAASWTLETAEDVCSGFGLERDQIVDTLSSLLDKSLLQVDYQPEETRFYYLDTVRAYARQKLHASGDRAGVRRSHLMWCVEFAERMEPLFWGAEQRYASTAVTREIDNIRAALETALEPDAPRGSALRLTSALGRYWFLDNIFAEGQAALSAALQSGEDEDPGLRARAAVSLAYLIVQRRDYEASERLAREVLERLRPHSDDRTIALALMVAAVCALFGPSGVDPRTILDDMQAHADRTGDIWTATFPQYAEALWAMKAGDTPRATCLLESALATIREIDDPYDFAAIAMQLGYSKFQLGDFEGAALLFIESAERSAPAKNLIQLGQCAEGLAYVAASMGAAEPAAELFGAADAFRAKSETPRWWHWQTSRETYWNAARAALGADEFEALWARGHALALEDPYAPIRQFAVRRAREA